MDVRLHLLVFGCLIALVTPIYFQDCGSNGFLINSVEVEDCTTTPCVVNVGTSVTVTVNSVNIDTDFSELHGQAYIMQLGHRWQLDVSPHDICFQWGGCPLSESTTRVYSGDVYFNSTLLRRPGQLRLTGIYEDSNAFCIGVPVELV